MKTISVKSVVMPVVSAAAFSVAACSTHFDKPGMSKAQLAQDEVTCTRQVTDTIDTYGGPITFKGTQVNPTCMKQLGYKSGLR